MLKKDGIKMRINDALFSFKSELQNKVNMLYKYQDLKLDEGDDHAVMDVAVDIREMKAKLEAVAYIEQLMKESTQ